MTVVLFRVDESPAVGSGHLVRCLALAEALGARGVVCRVLAQRLSDGRAEDLRRVGIAVHGLPGPAGGHSDRDATVSLAASFQADALVIDGYGFDAEYRRVARKCVPLVATFDDLADLPHLHADLVINGALGADPAPYERIAPGATLLLGPTYAALRRSIAAAAAAATALDRRTRILLAFGGSDPAGLTGPCMDRLVPRLPAGTGLTVVAGGANPRGDALEVAARGYGAAVAFHRNTTHMGPLMAEAGLAVSAAGGTTAELLAMGVPALIVVVAPNQEPAARQAEERGLCVVIDGRFEGAADRIVATALALWHDRGRRHALVRRGAGLVDGRGADRIADALLIRLRGGP